MGVRRLLLIRHGQYDERDEGTKDLTATGRKQAKLIARALDDDRIDAVHSSTMLRARTTAALIAEPRKMLIASTPLLCECIPTKVGFYIPAATIRDGRKQADRAFARFFKRTRTSRTELVVCHGNIIRYFIARAMGMKLTAWRSMAIFHASITDIRIHSDGRAILFAYNDVGHLPAKLRTMSAKAPKSMVRKMETETKTAKKAKAKVRAKKRALKPA